MHDEFNYNLMKIDVFAICYNEEIILPYFLRHYKQFARNITIYDNMSTDSSVDIMNVAGVKVVSYDSNNEFDESTYLKIKNNCWKDSDADWVIICDMDEFIYHPNLKTILENTTATHIITEGYEMLSEVLPIGDKQIYDEIKFGFFKVDYSKPCLFKPSGITESNFNPGCHTAKPEGNVISADDTRIKLLHYKYLNRNILISKYAHYAKRQSEEMKRKGWGNYQFWTPEILNFQFDKWLSVSDNIIDYEPPIPDIDNIINPPLVPESSLTSKKNETSSRASSDPTLL